MKALITTQELLDAADEIDRFCDEGGNEYLSDDDSDDVRELRTITEDSCKLTAKARRMIVEQEHWIRSVERLMDEE